MTYVPIVIPPPPPASPRVRQLSDEISSVIEDYERRFPDLSASDVRSAARLAVEKRGKSSSASRPTVAMAIGLLAFMGGVGVFMYRGGAGAIEGDSVPWVMVGVVGLMVVAGVLAVVRKMGE